MNSSTYRNALCLTAAALAASAAPASAEVYLTEAQALGVVLGEKAIVRREQRVLEAELRRKLEQSSNLRFPESTFTFFIANQDGRPSKYAIVMNEIGKTEPITFMVGMSLEGKVTEVVIMEFRENRGWEVKEKRFLNQFRGKTVRNSIRVDEDIINYTGATLSSKAVARGVKKALVLLDAFFPGESRSKLGAARDFSLPAEMRPIATRSVADKDLGLFREARYAMGTHCEIRSWCVSGNEACIFFEKGFQELERLEQMFSAYSEDSELSEVNRSASKNAVEASDEFFHLTQKALRFSRETNGLVDITVEPLLAAWGVGRSEARLPSEKELAAARKLVGSKNVILDQNRRSIKFRKPGVALDFGGIAKGYAAQRVTNLLEELGAFSALVNLGRSSLFASELRRDLRDSAKDPETYEQIGEWPIAITHPDGASQALGYFFLRAGKALSTSGTSERINHILNPVTAEPFEGVCSATVMAEDGVFCEVASKELLFLDSAQREEWNQRQGDVAWAHYEIGPGRNLLEHSSAAS